MFKVFIYWRLGLFLVAFLSSLAIVKIANGGPGAIGPNTNFNYWLSWAQWDGGHYLEIIQNGYQVPSDSAFFPLYPITVKLLSTVTFGNFILSGLLISNISFLLFLFVSAKLFKMHYPQKLAQNTLFAYIFYPATFFAVSFYSEGLYLLFCSLAYLYYYEKKYTLAFFLTSVSAVTRPFGILLAVALLTAYLISNIKYKNPIIFLDFSKHFLTAVFLPVIYLTFLLFKFQSPLTFFSVQGLWGREASDPISTIFSYIVPILTLEKRPLLDYLELFIFLSFLTILILGTKKIKTGYWIYSMLVILIPASTGTLSSIPRYAISSIGVFMLIGDYLTSHPKLRPFIFTGFLTLQILLLARFINGYWAG